MQILQHKEALIFNPIKETPSAKPGELIKFVKDSKVDVLYVDSKKVNHEKFNYNYL